jgi:serine/threonine protein kinase
MLIDFESVAESPFRLPEGFRRFRGWYPETLEGNVYTPYSDMYSLGKLLEEALPNSRTSLAEEFVRNLTNKQLSASDALQDPWLSGPIAALVS